MREAPPLPMDLRSVRRREAINYEFLMEARVRHPFMAVTGMGLKHQDVDRDRDRAVLYGPYFTVPFILEGKRVWGFDTAVSRTAFCADFKAMPIPYDFTPRDIRLWDSFQ